LEFSRLALTLVTKVEFKLNFFEKIDFSRMNSNFPPQVEISRLKFKKNSPPNFDPLFSFFEFRLQFEAEVNYI